MYVEWYVRGWINEWKSKYLRKHICEYLNSSNKYPHKSLLNIDFKENAYYDKRRNKCNLSVVLNWVGGGRNLFSMGYFTMSGIVFWLLQLGGQGHGC